MTLRNSYYHYYWTYLEGESKLFISHLRVDLSEIDAIRLAAFIDGEGGRGYREARTAGIVSYSFQGRKEGIVYTIK